MTTALQNYRGQVSFNPNDCRVSTDSDGRIVVRLGVRRRDEIVMRTVVRLGTASLSEITNAINARRALPYSCTDIQTSLRRLARPEYVILEGHSYSPCKRATELLKKAQQEVLTV
jgi:hypothetical protein